MAKLQSQISAKLELVCCLSDEPRRKMHTTAKAAPVPWWSVFRLNLFSAYSLVGLTHTWTWSLWLTRGLFALVEVDLALHVSIRWEAPFPLLSVSLRRGSFRLKDHFWDCVIETYPFQINWSTDSFDVGDWVRLVQDWLISRFSFYFFLEPF